ncbi:MAG: hypothetical protein M1829_000942 [Trizodia sp. TS-e1964]|nr:MAG: hypothetical protein M1829_000942 [Trizodia sp. TS-e1964]
MDLDSPRADGNATYLTEPNFDMSQELSFRSPRKETHDLVKQLQNNRRGLPVNTPRSRPPFADRRNVPSVAPRAAEFTPILKSVQRNNLLRQQRKSTDAGVPTTPAIAKSGYKSVLESPALPFENSGIYETTGMASYFSVDIDETPVPHIPSSSVASTPTTRLPRQDGGGVLTTGANVMTLKEQENLIDKVEKENFNLKLKIHFLEESLKKAGPGFSKAVLKENTDLKVERATLQKDFLGYRKTLAAAEKNIKAYQKQLLEAQEEVNRKHVDESHRVEADKLRDELEDIQAELREKQRLIDEREEEIDELRESAQRQATTITELQDQFQSSAEQVESTRDLEEAQVRLEEAQAYKETREQLSDIQRELEEDRENWEFEKRHLEGQFDQAEEQRQAMEAKYRRAEEQRTGLEARYQQAEYERTSLETQLQKSEEQRKILELQNRRTQEDAADLKRTVEQLRQSEDSISARDLRMQEKLESERRRHEEESVALGRQNEELNGEIDSVRQNLEDVKLELANTRGKVAEKERQFNIEQENWETKRRNLESQCERSEEQAAGLKLTIEKLRRSEGTLSGRETQMQEALDSEKQRHAREEAVLSRQINELNAEVASKRQTIEEFRSQLSQTKEELRIGQCECVGMAEKIVSLEDEIEVLQASLDEEASRSKEEISAARQETEGIRRQLHSIKHDMIRAEVALAAAQTEIETFRGDLKAGEGSKAQLNQRLQDADRQLSMARKEKQEVQDQLANVNIEKHSLQNHAGELNAEKEELKVQINSLQHQLDNKMQPDQEIIDLRKSKARLESEFERLREGRSSLIQKSESLEKQLVEEFQKATAEENRLLDEIANLHKQLSITSEGRERELLTSKNNATRLEQRIGDLELELENQIDIGVGAAEASILRRNISSARHKETEYSQREASYKVSIRDLRLKILDLERTIHELEAAPKPPSPSINASIQKNEAMEVKRQLIEANQQARDLRAKVRETERDTQRKLKAVLSDQQGIIDSFNHERDALELELLESRRGLEEALAKSKASNEQIGKLRLKVTQLEREARLSQTGDHKVSEERRELHKHLKDAKIQVEELQVQIQDRDQAIQMYTQHLGDLRSQLARIRAERASQRQKASALTSELFSLQRHHSQSVDKIARLQASWEAERKALTSGVRFPNMSISDNDIHPLAIPAESTEVLQLELALHRKDKRHAQEIKGLVKQIQWLRARCEREEAFRADLAYSKRFFMLQVEMYNACNHADLEMLAEMGISPDRSIRERRPTLRAVGLMVVAAMRMRKRQQSWAVSKKLQASLVKGLEAIRKKKRLDASTKNAKAADKAAAATAATVAAVVAASKKGGEKRRARKSVNVC